MRLQNLSYNGNERGKVNLKSISAVINSESLWPQLK